ncbi:MAG TPA: hypothetical protein VF551_08715, partial [Chthoniobacterales bacterium]
MRDVLLHHQHVLHTAPPRQWWEDTTATRTSADTSGGPRQAQPARAGGSGWRQASSAALDNWSRRYGH